MLVRVFLKWAQWNQCIQDSSSCLNICETHKSRCFTMWSAPYVQSNYIHCSNGQRKTVMTYESNLSGSSVSQPNTCYTVEPRRISMTPTYIPWWSSMMMFFTFPESLARFDRWIPLTVAEQCGTFMLFGLWYRTCRWKSKRVHSHSRLHAAYVTSPWSYFVRRVIIPTRKHIFFQKL